VCLIDPFRDCDTKATRKGGEASTTTATGPNAG